MTSVEPSSVPPGFSASENALLAGPISTILEMVEALSETPLTPEQYQCVYRLNAAAVSLWQFVRRPDAIPQPAPPVPAAPEPEICSILLLDAGRKLPEILTQRLDRIPHRIDHCLNRADALSLLRRRRYDVVLADPRCAPELPSLVRIVERERGEDRRIPVIALQARDARQSPADILEAGFDARIPKPFDRDALLAALARFTSIPYSPATPAVRVMQREFLARALASVPVAREALARFDAPALFACSDLVSGAAEPLGFDLLARAGARLRSATRQNDWTRARQFLDEIAAEAEMAARAADIGSNLCGTPE